MSYILRVFSLTFSGLYSLLLYFVQHISVYSYRDYLCRVAFSCTVYIQIFIFKIMAERQYSNYFLKALVLANRRVLSMSVRTYSHFLCKIHIFTKSTLGDAVTSPNQYLLKKGRACILSAEETPNQAAKKYYTVRLKK